MANQQAKKDDNRVNGLLIHDSTGAETRQVRGTLANPNALPIEIIANTSSVAGTTATPARVGDSATSVTIVAANTSRKLVEFFNDSAAVLYLRKGTDPATITDYTVKIPQDGYYADDRYTGAYRGIWASDAGGGVQVTETT